MMTDTVRTQVLDAIADKFRTMQAAEPAEDPYGVEWSIVSRDPIKQLTKGKARALGVYGTDTQRKGNFPFVTVTLGLVIEVHVAKVENKDMSRTVEEHIGVVERRLKEDGTLGGLVHDIIVTGDQVTVDGPYDNQAEGALFCMVRYSQQENDPRQGR